MQLCQSLFYLFFYFKFHLSFFFNMYSPRVKKLEKEKIISVMKRYDLKYLLNNEQLKQFMDRINDDFR